MKHEGQQTIFDAALIVGAPLLLAVVELFHPHADDLLALDVRPWLEVHYAQIVLFPLAALAVMRLVHTRRDIAAAICRLAMFVFAVAWVSWDSVAGVTTGILVQSAHLSGSAQTWRSAVEALWADPIMGGRLGLFAVLGSAALSIGTVAAGVSLKLAGRSWGPVILLAVSGFGIGIFKTHAWPGGPLTFGGIALAGAWLIWQGAQQRKSNTLPAGQNATVLDRGGS